MRLVRLTSAVAVNPRFIMSVALIYPSGSVKRIAEVKMRDGATYWSECSYAETVDRIDAALGGDNDDRGTG